LAASRRKHLAKALDIFYKQGASDALNFFQTRNSSHGQSET
jgi:hypothetical protein